MYTSELYLILIAVVVSQFAKISVDQSPVSSEHHHLKIHTQPPPHH